MSLSHIVSLHWGAQGAFLSSLCMWLTQIFVMGSSSPGPVSMVLLSWKHGIWHSFAKSWWEVERKISLWPFLAEVTSANQYPYWISNIQGLFLDIPPEIAMRTDYRETIRFAVWQFLSATTERSIKYLWTIMNHRTPFLVIRWAMFWFEGSIAASLYSSCTA